MTVGVEDRERKWREVNPASLRSPTPAGPDSPAASCALTPRPLGLQGNKRGHKVVPQPAEKPQPRGWEVEGGEVQVTGLPKAMTDALGG